MGQDKPNLANVDRAVRDASARGMTKISTFVQDLYSLALIDLTTLKLLSNKFPLSVGPSSAVGDNISPEYSFKLPPKVHEFTEAFATNIVGTQEGGKYIESHGIPISDIRISGTTGFRPHANSSKTLKVFGIDTGSTGPLAQVLNLGGFGTSPDLAGTVTSVLSSASPWQEGEALGHDDIIFLRNLFRLFSWHKINSPKAGQVVMLWRNIKDADYWIVEPQEFRLAQNSGSPLTYEYSIHMKTIAKWDHKIRTQVAQDPLQFQRDAATFYARVEQSSATIRNSFLTIANQIDRVARIPYNVSTFVLGPLAGALEGAAAVRRSEKRFLDLFRSSCQKVKDNLTLYGKELQLYLPPQDEITNAVKKARQAVERLLADPSMKTESVNTVSEDSKKHIIDNYTATISADSLTPGYAGEKSYIGNQSFGKSIQQTIVQPGDTIRAIAGRVLGDKTQYHTLIVLNKLNAPYISPNGGKGILRPGDTILYPSSTIVDSDFGIISSTKTSIAETSTSSDANSGGSIQQQYGRDLRLFTSKINMYGEQLDLAINQNGDLSTIVGIPNISQAVKVKFSITRGELPLHQYFGALFPMGTKMTSTTMAGFRLDVEQTLLSDPRLADIKSLKFVSAGDTLQVNARILLADSSSTVKLTFPIRVA